MRLMVLLSLDHNRRSHRLVLTMFSSLGFDMHTVFNLHEPSANQVSNSLDSQMTDIDPVSRIGTLVIRTLRLVGKPLWYLIIIDVR